jgi:hypothetical protein
MKYNRYAYIPAVIDINQIATKARLSRTDADKAAYILGLLIYLPLINVDVVKPNGYVAISAKILESNIGRYRVAMQLLMDHGIVECDNSYVAGGGCLGYRITEVYPTSDLLRYELTSSVLHKKFCKQERQRLCGVRQYHFLWKWFRTELSIDVDHAQSIIDDNDLSMAHMLAVDAISSNRWRFRVDNAGGRLHTNFTNLKRELRAACRYQGMPLAEIDIRSSQPYFLSLILAEYIRNTHNLSHHDIQQLYQGMDVPEHLSDVHRYILLLSAGTFYSDYRQSLYTLTERKMSIRETKKAFYRAAYGRGIRHTVEVRALQRQYPTLYAAIDKAKVRNYKDLAIGLQRVESDAVLGAICRRITRELPKAPLYTIHDSVMTTHEYADQVRDIMTSELLYITGIPPVLNDTIFY